MDFKNSTTKPGYCRKLYDTIFCLNSSNESLLYEDENIYSEQCKNNMNSKSIETTENNCVKSLHKSIFADEETMDNKSDKVNLSLQDKRQMENKGITFQQFKIYNFFILK